MIPTKNAGGANGSFRNVMEMVRSAVTKTLPTLPQKDTVFKIGEPSLESFGADDLQLFQNAHESLTGNFAGVSTEAFKLEGQMDTGASRRGGLEYTSLENANWMNERQHQVSVEAASILAMAHNNPGAYKSIEPRQFDNDVRINDMTTSGSYGSIPVAGVTPSMESFDETETEKWREYSYAVNLMAAKTHPFADLFYPLFVTTPENAGWLMSIRRTLVWDGYTNTDLSGKEVKMVKRNALEALLDHTILETESTRLYPVVTEENKEWFIDPTVLAPTDRTQGEDTFKTSYIKFNTAYSFNLLSLCQTPSRMSKGAPNWTDSLDRRIALDDIVFKIADDVLILNVNRDTYAQFLAPREYNFRDMTVKFHPRGGINLKPENLNAAGVVPAALKGLFDKGYGINITLKIDGEINVESSNGQVRCAPVQFSHCFKLNDPSKIVELTDPAVKALIPASVEALGFLPEARTTNLNQLERGKLVDSDVMKEGFIIPTLPPICIVKPTQMDDEKVYPKIESLQFIYRTQLRNDAVTSLLNRAETLETYLGNGVTHPLESNLGMEGMGQYYYRPRFVRTTINVKDELNNMNSAKKMTDIQGLLVGRMNELLYDMNREIGYSAALEEQFPGSTPKVHVAIGTDLYLPQFLMIQGDDRTTGIGFDHSIASISDLRMRNKIIMQFTLPGEKDPHPLQSGVCGMIPEFIANFQMIRSQRIANEIRLTPRYRYFNIGVNMIVIEVEQLAEAVAERTQLNVNEKTVKDFPGHETPVVPQPGA